MKLLLLLLRFLIAVVNNNILCNRQNVCLSARSVCFYVAAVVTGVINLATINSPPRIEKNGRQHHTRALVTTIVVVFSCCITFLLFILSFSSRSQHCFLSKVHRDAPQSCLKASVLFLFSLSLSLYKVSFSNTSSRVVVLVLYLICSLLCEKKVVVTDSFRPGQKKNTKHTTAATLDGVAAAAGVD